jgi:hypothetical protein
MLLPTVRVCARVSQFVSECVTQTHRSPPFPLPPAPSPPRPAPTPTHEPTAHRRYWSQGLRGYSGVSARFTVYQQTRLGTGRLTVYLQLYSTVYLQLYSKVCAMSTPPRVIMLSVTTLSLSSVCQEERQSVPEDGCDRVV